MKWLILVLVFVAGLLSVPSQPVRAQDTSWIVNEIYAAGSRHGVSGDWLLRTARCESNLNPYAVGSQGEYGLFQIKLWIWPQAGTSVYSQSDFAARMFASGHSYYWVCA